MVGIEDKDQNIQDYIKPLGDDFKEKAKTWKSVKDSNRFFFILLLLFVIFLSIQIKLHWSLKRNLSTIKNLQVSTGLLSPTPPSLTKAIKELEAGQLKGVIRYVDSRPDYSKGYSDGTGFLNVITLNLETMKTTSTKFDYKNAWLRELTPDGNYISVTAETESKERIETGGGSIPAYTVCHYYVTNLSNMKTYQESERGACGGPPPNYEMTQLPKGRLVTAGRGKLTLLSNTMKPILSFPSQGVTRSDFNFSSDYNYYIYASISSLVSLDDFYPTFGIIKYDDTNSNILKFFNEDKAVANSFICWINHKVLFSRTNYKVPPDGITAGNVVSEGIYSFDVDSGNLEKLCDGDSCESVNKANCNDVSVGLYDTYPKLDQSTRDLVDNISQTHDLKRIGTYTDLPMVNKDGSLVVFSAKYYDLNSYVFLIDVGSGETYKVDKGEQPRWIYN